MGNFVVLVFSVLLTENSGRAWRVHCSRRSTVSGSAGLRACSRKACSTTSSTSCCRPFTVCSTRRPDTTRIKSTNSSPVTSSNTWGKKYILSTCVLICFSVVFFIHTSQHPVDVHYFGDIIDQPRQTTEGANCHCSMNMVLCNRQYKMQLISEKTSMVMHSRRACQQVTTKYLYRYMSHALTLSDQCSHFLYKNSTQIFSVGKKQLSFNTTQLKSNKRWSIIWWNTSDETNRRVRNHPSMIKATNLFKTMCKPSLFQQRHSPPPPLSWCPLAGFSVWWTETWWPFLALCLPPVGSERRGLQEYLDDKRQWSGGF